jgi:hypothetical protein
MKPKVVVGKPKVIASQKKPDDVELFKSVPPKRSLFVRCCGVIRDDFRRKVMRRKEQEILPDGKAAYWQALELAYGRKRDYTEEKDGV